MVLFMEITGAIYFIVCMAGIFVHSWNFSFADVVRHLAAWPDNPRPKCGCEEDDPTPWL